MRHIVSYLAIVVVLVVSTAHAKETSVKVVLGDGSIFYGTVTTTKLTVQTPFGKVTVPLDSVDTLAVGSKQRAGLKDFIQNRLEKIASTINEDKRETLKEEIRKKGFVAIPILEELLSEKEEQASVIEDVLSGIEVPAYVDEEFLGLEDDKIIAGESTLSGDIKTKTIKVKSSFGTVNLKTDTIYALKFFHPEGGDGQRIVKTFTVPANVYIASNQSMDTKLRVGKGKSLKITTTGSIVLASLSYQTFTPDGNGSSGSWNGFPFGALCAKVGTSGQWFLAGSKYKGKATDSGTLWLTISETLFSASNTGEYKVKVEVGK